MIKQGIVAVMRRETRRGRVYVYLWMHGKRVEMPPPLSQDAGGKYSSWDILLPSNFVPFPVRLRSLRNDRLFC